MVWELAGDHVFYRANAQVMGRDVDRFHERSVFRNFDTEYRSMPEMRRAAVSHNKKTVSHSEIHPFQDKQQAGQKRLNHWFLVFGH